MHHRPLWGRRGLRIAAEGPGGGGKSTFCAALCERLNDGRAGVPAKIIKEPSKSDWPQDQSTARAYAYFTEDRKLTQADSIQSALFGFDVIHDRHYASTAVHQGYIPTGGPAAWAIMDDQARLFGSPDIWVFIVPSLDVLVKRALARGKEPDADRIRMKRDGFRSVYGHLCQRAPTRLDRPMIFSAESTDEIVRRVTLRMACIEKERWGP